MKATEKAYIAGLLDGEGSISMLVGSTPARIGYYLQVEVTQHTTRRALLDFCSSKFGGEVKTIEAKQHSYLQWNGSRAKKILLKLLPYLTVKKSLAKLAITNEVTRELIKGELSSSKELPPDYLMNLQKQTFNMMKDLNHKETRLSVTETEREDLISLHRKARQLFLEERNKMRQSTP